MDSRSSSNTRHQQFRLLSSPGTPLPSVVVYIPAWHDKTTGLHVVVWEDIQQVIKNAQYIMDGIHVVPFLRDENLSRYLPWRILYRPEAVLTLVAGQEVSGIEDTSCQDGSCEKSPILLTTLTPDSSSPPETLIASSPSCFTGRDTLLSCLGSPASTHTNYSPVMSTNALALAEELSAEQQLSLQSYRDLFDRYFQAMMCGQVIQGTDIKNLMSEHFDNLNVALDENKALQGSILEMQQRMHDMQRQTLDRLAAIHSRIQAVFTQTFELHEYPIPRLFIVLPKPKRRRDQIGAPFSKQFRLYFLCECGEHTRINGSKISHEVHLAKHDGYDLNNPTEFFEKYGNYILAMMQMIKFGFTAAGVVVPALTDFKLVEGLGTIQKSLELGKNTIGALVDETIGFIEDKQGEDGAITGSTDGHLKLDQQEVLEGADLRQLEAYLSVQDEGRTLGNLYRTVTSEGHVKWVCMDHFRATYRDKIMEPLKRFVYGNGGVFHEELGIVEKVNLASQDQAEDLYEAVSTARGITQMAFKLAWDASHGDLRTLRKAMDKANIMDLIIEGTSFKKAVMSTPMLSRRYQPILELMSNRRVQSLRLKGFDQFYLRLGKISTFSAPQLRILSIDAPVDFSSPTVQPIFDQILRGCPSLTELSVASDNIEELLQYFKDNISCFQSLRTLTIQSSVGLDLITSFFKDQPASLHAIIYYYPRIKAHLAYLLQGHLTELTVKEVSRCEAEIEPLCQTIASNPNLATIKIGAEGQLYPSLISHFESIRDDRRKGGGELNACRLQLFSDDCVQGYGDSIMMKVDFTNSNTPSDVSIDLIMGQGTSSGGTKLKELFSKYGWAFKMLTTNDTFTDLHARHLCKRTVQRSKLSTLTLNPFSLTAEGISTLDRAMHGFTNLQQFSLHLEGLHDAVQLSTAVQLLKWYGMRLEGLTLSGEGPATWLTELKSTISSKEAVPKLKTFSIIGSQEQEITSEQAQWIATMFPVNDLISASTLSASLSSPVNTIDPLEMVTLNSVSMSVDDWNTILKAMDYTAIIKLSFDHTNFSQENLSQLLRYLPENDLDIALKSISLVSTQYAKSRCPSLEKALRTRAGGLVLILCQETEK
ncbi:hypothetical protein EC968_008920 [Mortierella alpina]|nr:hypothetical protein EC968_008920 [Mortierella alpina]